MNISTIGADQYGIENIGLMGDSGEQGLSFDLDQSKFSLSHDIGVCGEDLWVETIKRGDALFSQIVRHVETLDIERLKESINPKMEKPVFLNRNFDKGVVLLVKNLVTPFCGFVKDTGQLAVNTSKEGWKLTKVFIPLSKN